MKILRPLKASILILMIGLAAATCSMAQSGQKPNQSSNQGEQATTPVTPQPAKKQSPAAQKSGAAQEKKEGSSKEAARETAVTSESAEASSPAPAAPAMSEAEALPQGTPFVPDLNMFGPTTAELRQRLATALRNDPALHGSNIVANVSDDTISLTGSVRTAKDRETARRIAESFASNRKVKEKITVAGSAAKGGVGQSASEVSAPTNPKTQSTAPSRPTTQKPESPNRPVTDPANAQEKPRAGE